MFQVSTLEPKKHKKISIVFGEGLQILVFRKVCLGFFMLFKVSINTTLVTREGFSWDYEAPNMIFFWNSTRTAFLSLLKSVLKSVLKSFR